MISEIIIMIIIITTSVVNQVRPSQVVDDTLRAWLRLQQLHLYITIAENKASGSIVILTVI